MAPPEQPKVIRPLSNLLPENLAEGSLEAVQDAFHRAMALTVLEHPILQVGILNEDSAVPSWIELKSVNLGNHISWQEVKASESYDACLKEAIRNQLDSWFLDVETKPGWRISMLWPEGTLQSLDVIFCWNHTNFDGVAGKILHRSLLSNLNNPRVGQEPPNLNGNVLQLESVADKFPPPPEKLIKIPISLGFALSTIWKELRPPFLVSSDPTQASWAPILEEPYRTEFRTFSIDDATLKKVIDKCRAHKTTMAGLLHALPLASLALQLGEDQKHYKKEAKSMYAITALDTRRFIPANTEAYPWHVPSTTMDNQMTICDHLFDEKLVGEIRRKGSDASSEDEIMTRLEDIVWSAAVQARQDIQEKLDRGMSNDPSGLMNFVKDWRVQKKQQLKKPRVGAWGVSNLGTLNGEVEGSGSGWEIERAVFQLSCELTSPVFHISSISVKGKELCVDVSWQEGVVEAEVGDKLASDMEAWLRFLGARA
ncbi:Alcohol acetyltransferase [Fusarium torreyae]|uniref:Alcohol acetyltransferase n=1 Tax=Fusarium torreyae TaxID=1237075 RepID=A0A9W8SI16_9HYPO|nr:Alcohol acetyltransferase [Fusarium torreyae]